MESTGKRHHYPELDSTNRVALDMLRRGTGDGGTVITAERQLAGRGQHERSFVSPTGGLYASFILDVDLPIEHRSLVTLATGVACGRVLEWQGLDRVLLKWPNDLMFAEKKLGGILVESSLSADAATSIPLVIGIGLNVNSSSADFAPPLAETVTTLKDCTGKEHCLEDLLDKILWEVQHSIETLGRNPAMILDLWHLRDYLGGRQVVHRQGERSTVGTGLGIDRSGRYVIKDASGFLHRVLSGTLRVYSRSKR